MKIIEGKVVEILHDSIAFFMIIIIETKNGDRVACHVDNVLRLKLRREKDFNIKEGDGVVMPIDNSLDGHYIVDDDDATYRGKVFFSQEEITINGVTYTV